MSEYDFSMEDPRWKAAVDMIRRTGARSFQIRFSDDDEPVVWMALAEYGLDEKNKPIAKGGKPGHLVGAALDPVNAVFDLLDRVVDGGHCSHCNRPTGVTFEFDTMPLDELICWYQYDPELEIFRRGCE